MTTSETRPTEFELECKKLASILKPGDKGWSIHLEHGTTPGEPDVCDMIAADVMARKAVGMARYGKPLTADDPRDMLQEAIEEQADSQVYLKIEQIKKRKAARAFAILEAHHRDGYQQGRGVSAALRTLRAYFGENQ